LAPLIAAEATVVDPRPLIVHVVYRFSVGGLENGVVNLINHMPAHKWRHAVVSLTDIDDGFAARVLRKDVRFFALHKAPGHGFRVFPQFWRLLRALRPAIVHTRNLAALEMQAPAWAARVPGRVHGEHGRDADDVHGTNKTNIRIRRAYRRFVHQTIALGGEITRYVRDQVHVPPQALHTIYNGVDVTRFQPATTRMLISGSPFSSSHLWLVGTVGRMMTVKAQPLLAEAFVLALRQRPALRERMRLVMVGDGPLRQPCEQILRSAGMADLAWFVGERTDVPDVMRGLNCFALPSLMEGISNTILEAMASALPVLATRVGANPELVEDGVTGRVVPPADAQALALGLMSLAAHPQASTSMGLAGREAVERRFSMQAMVDAYERVYVQLLRPPTIWSK